MDEQEKIIKKFKLTSSISMVLAVATIFFAAMYAFSGWSLIPVIIAAVPAVLLNGLARTYKEALQAGTDYGDPTGK